MVKTARTQWWRWVMVATENDDMASTTHVNTSANESPRDEQNFEKRCV
jgi:hypothetical protein